MASMLRMFTTGSIARCAVGEPAVRRPPRQVSVDLLHLRS
jgi:hypothetical protein